MIARLKSEAKKRCPEALWRSIAKTWAILYQSRLKGFSLRLNFPDRILLEDVILPDLIRRSDIQRVLFVGCDWYTKSYPAMFRGKEFWTLEIDPAKARYGGQRHVIDGVQNIVLHFEEQYFDAIIHTGVFGWGLDEKRDVEDCFEGCHRCLRPGGLLVLGWDDVPEHRPFHITQECQALRRFAPCASSPLGVAEHLVADDRLRHTFNLYTKPEHSDGTVQARPEPKDKPRFSWPWLGAPHATEEMTWLESLVLWFESPAQMALHLV